MQIKINAGKAKQMDGSLANTRHFDSLLPVDWAGLSADLNSGA